MLHLFDDIRRLVEVSQLLRALAPTGEINQVCEEFQIVLQWLERPTAVAGSFRGVDTDLIAPFSEQSEFDVLATLILVLGSCIP
jgi:hypothetical protein